MSHAMPLPLPTFSELRTALDLEPDTSRRKLMVTTLGHFTEAFGLRPDDDTSVLLEEAAAATSKTYYAMPSFKDLGYGTRNNRKSAFRLLCRMAQRLQAERIPVSAISHPFLAELATIISEGKMKSARHMAECRAVVDRGSLPDTERAVRLLAIKFGVASERLLQHVHFWKPQRLFDLRNPGYTWGENLHALQVACYRFKTLPPSLEAVWRPFLTWRTATSSDVLRVTHVDGSSHTIKRRGGWSYRNGQDRSEPTASEHRFVSTLRGFYGFASLPKKGSLSSQDAPVTDDLSYGLGIPAEKLRLVHFLQAENLLAYCAFQERRNGRFDHAELSNFVSMIRMLIGHDRGYACQAQMALLDDFRAVLGEAVPGTPEAWRAWCQQQWTVLQSEVGRLTEGRTGKNKFQQSRSPKDALRFILEKPFPMEEVVWPTVLHLIENRPSTLYSVGKRFHHEAKIFTLASLASEPLRARNWCDICWGLHLHRREDGWYLLLKKSEFKNRRVLHEDYYSRFEDAVQPIVTAYYEIWKEKWGYDPLSHENRSKRSYVQSGASPDVRCSAVMLSKRLSFLKVLWGLTIGPHAFRHIFATDWLKRHPQDFFTVAGKLNDQIGTVLREYGHLNSSDHSRRVNTANAGVMDRAQKHLAAAKLAQRPQAA